MGLYDTVRLDGDDFRCSEGHSLAGLEFQSKDFGETMGVVFVSDKRVSFTPGGYGDPVSPPLLGRFEVYSDCPACPAFVQAGTFNLVACWVSFVLEVVDDEVRKVVRITQTTAEWLKREPTQPWMRDCIGPMPYAEALAIRHARLLRVVEGG